MPNFPEYADDPILRRLADLERAVEEIRTSTGLRSASVTDEAGAVRLRVGRVGSLFGAVLYNAAGEQTVVLDENGLSAYDAAGAQTVMLDETGLTIAGGTARAIDVDGGEGSVVNPTLTTGEQTLITVNLTPPTWARSALVLAFTKFQLTNTSGGAVDIRVRTTVDGSPSSGNINMTVANSTTGYSIDMNQRVLSTLPAVIPCTTVLSVSSGTNTTNNAALEAFAIYLR